MSPQSKEPLQTKRKTNILKDDISQSDDFMSLTKIYEANAATSSTVSYCSPARDLEMCSLRHECLFASYEKYSVYDKRSLRPR